MNKYLLLLIITFIPFFSNAEDNFIVKNTYIEGLYRIPKNIIISKIPFYEIEEYSINLNDVNKLIKSILSTQYFSRVKVLLNNKNSLIIKLEENPVITSIYFKGNKILNDKFLNDFFKKKKIILKEPLNEIQIFNIKNELLNIYKDKGNFNTEIEIKKDFYSLNRVKIEFIFKEGKFSNIEKINIHGNNLFSSYKLLKKLKSYNGLFLINKFFKTIYKEKYFIEDINRLKKFYRKNGYLNFEIKDKKIKFSEDKLKVYIDLYISEGNKYIIKENEIIGNFDKTYYKEIKQISSNIFKNNKCQFNKIDKIENNIKDFLIKKGYSYPIINTNIILHDNNETAKLQFNISSGLKCYVRNIDIVGNKQTSDEVIRREISQMEFSSLNPSLLLEDMNKLNELKFFKSINIQTKPIDNYQVDLIYKVEEIPFSGIKAGLNLGSKGNLNFNCDIVQDNILGSGSSISFKSNYNSKSTNTEILINDPYFLKGRKFRVGSKFFYYHSVQENSTFNLLNNNYGYSNTFNIPISNKLWAYHEIIYNINNLKSFCENEFIFYDLDLLNEIKNTIFYISDQNKKINPLLIKFKDYIISSYINFDSLNNIIFPKKGKKLKLINKFTVPKISDNKYFLTILSLENYSTDNYFNCTFYNKIQLYFMNTFYRKITPSYNYFFADKIDLVRGFEEKIHDFNFDYVRSAGMFKSNVFNDTKVVFKNELLLPTNLLGDRYDNIFRISYFLDYGFNIKSKKKINRIIDSLSMRNYKSMNKIYASTGLNFKILSPIGPIRFSYNLPILKNEEDTIERFQLSFGKKW